ncbi:MAG: heme-binding protein [Phycisphaerales bacterium]|nr:heme-binding protein [Phycisphaerales bacterium]
MIALRSPLSVKRTLTRTGAAALAALLPLLSAAGPNPAPSATQPATAPSTKPARAAATQPKPPGRGELMDYGPFLSYSVLRPKAATAVKPAAGHPTPQKTDTGEILAVKGISIKVGNNASVCFDTDLLSVAGGWVGGFLDVRKTNLNSDRGDAPASIRGALAFSTTTDPGWAKGESFADPRDAHDGPLPADWAHYKGLFRCGDKVVLSYTVGKTEVLELEGSVADGGQVAFTRTMRMGASVQPHKMNLCELEGAVGTLRPTTALGREAAGGSQKTVIQAEGMAAVLSRDGRDTAVSVINAPKGATLEVVDNFRIQLNLPALRAPAVFKVVIATVPHASIDAFAPLVKAATKVADPSTLCTGGPARWPQAVVTRGVRAADSAAYVVDTVRLPDDNPWKSWIRPGGFDFFADGRCVVCTWNGDVWIASGLDDTLGHVSWKRFAAGLYEPLGLKIVDDAVYVLGRDQITRLHDLNSDGEADYYENFCNAWPSSPIYHAFNMDLQADAEGNFYFATCGNQAPLWMHMKGVALKVPKYGGTAEVFATGLRAPNGMGVGPHGEIVCSDNQGHWTPVCRINLLKKGGFYGFVADPRRVKKEDAIKIPERFDPPICWIRYPSPDNSSGGQVWAGDKFGPLSGSMLTTSYGQSDLMELMWEDIGGVAQGGVVKLPLKFESGIMRARVSPGDGQVWVAGLKGWQTNAIKEGCLQRVRYTGKPAHVPVALHVLKDSISITFSDPLDPQASTDEQNWGIEQWNYQWTSQYGSKDFKQTDARATGHDEVEVKAVKLSEDRKTITLQTPPLSPVMQMAITMRLKAADGSAVEWEIDNTINKIP